MFRAAVIGQSIGLARDDPDTAKLFVVVEGVWEAAPCANDMKFGDPEPPESPKPKFKPKLMIQGKGNNGNVH